jgi:hypothetical protein
MSALGQKRTFAVQNGMSAVTPEADMCGATWDIRLQTGHKTFPRQRFSFGSLVLYRLHGIA